MKKVGLLILLVLCVQYGWAQNPPNTLPTEQVEVTKAFDAELLESEKQKTTPLLPILTTEQAQPTPQTYSLLPKFLPVTYDAPVIKPLSIKNDSLGQVYDLYAKVGFGNPFQPFADVRYEKVIDKLAIGLGANYHGANYKKLENQRFSDAGLQLAGAYYLSAFKVLGGVGYRQSTDYFYGYDHEAQQFTKEQVQRKASTILANFGVASSSKNVGDVRAEALVDFYNLKETAFDASELGVHPKLKLGKYFNEKHLLQLAAGYQLTSLTAHEKQTIGIAYVNPSFELHSDVFKAKLGATGALAQQKFYIYPDVEIGIAPAGGVVSFFAGWQGKVLPNSMQAQLENNPYLATDTLSLSVVSFEDRYAGLRGQIQGITYEIKGGHSPVRNMPLFVNNPTDEKMFDVVYDTLSVIHAEGKIGAKLLSEQLRLGIGAGFNKYTTQTQLKAWHLPTLTLQGDAAYTLFKKLDLSTKIFFGSGITYRATNATTQTLSPIFDANAGATYTINKNISVYLEANNLANRKYARWNLYPVFGFNALGGLIVKF